METPQVSPLLYWNHWTPDWAGFTGNCAVGAVPYTGTLYPESYLGDSSDRAVFIADFGGQWIQVIWVDENDNFNANKGVQMILTGIGPVCAMKVYKPSLILIPRLIQKLVISTMFVLMDKFTV
jgi:hypothetical protein